MLPAHFRRMVRHEQCLPPQSLRMIKRPHFTAALRPNRRPRSIWRECPAERREAAAAVVIYEGSPYHRRGGAGQPTATRRYPAASKCDAKWTNELATQALRSAILQGLVSPDDDWRGSFPRYVWYRDGAVVYQAFLHNEGSGAYHAFPLNKEEWPVGLE